MTTILSTADLDLDQVFDDGSGDRWQVIAISRNEDLITLQQLDADGEQTDEQIVTTLDEVVETFTLV